MDNVTFEEFKKLELKVDLGGEEREVVAASNEDKTDLSILMLDHDLPSGSKIS